MLAFVVGFLFPRTYGPLLTSNSFGVGDSIYDGLTLTEGVKRFHLENNGIVNVFLEQLLDPDYATLGYVSYPPDLEGSTEPNCEDNVSTFCLAVYLNYNLEEFEVFLQKNKDKLNFGTAEDDSSNPITLEDAFEEASAQRSLVDTQTLLAEDTIDLTLAVYNQVQIVYPVHEEMLALIQNLDDYRGNLASVRDVIEKYPSKFNGASTAQCK